MVATIKDRDLMVDRYEETFRSHDILSNCMLGG